MGDTAKPQSSTRRRTRGAAGVSKQIVITVHGVNPDRKWQERVGRVLAPHFDCRTFTYYGYDTLLGPVRAVANITAFAIALCLGASSVFELLAKNWFVAILLFVAGILSLALSFFLARLKRVRYTHFIKRQIGAASAYSRPSIVAHSLGTYLVGSVLRKFPDIHLANVLLVSSVLPRTFPWRILLEQRPTCVLKVRNEFGTADSVTKLVGKLQWLLRDLGPSGAFGFDGDDTVIHTCDSPLADCALCQAKPVKVHNVPLEDYGHSTEFLGDGHARYLWLPFLWGFSPNEFFHYLETCQTAARLQQEGQWNEVDNVVAQLWETTFTWTNGMRLIDYVKEFMTARLKRPPAPAAPASVDELIEATTTVLHIMTDEACSEVAKQGFIDENVARGLHPRIATVRAVEYIINPPRAA
jgi:uncharacterized membrane protein